MAEDNKDKREKRLLKESDHSHNNASSHDAGVYGKKMGSQ